MPFATQAKRRPNAVLFAAPESTSPTAGGATSDGPVLPEEVLSSIFNSTEDPWTRASQASSSSPPTSVPMPIGGGGGAAAHVRTSFGGDGGAGDEVRGLCEGFGRTTLLGSDAEFETAYSIGDELGRGGWATVFTARRRRRGSAAVLVERGGCGSGPSPHPLPLLHSASGWLPPPPVASGAALGRDEMPELAVKVLEVGLGLRAK